MGGKWQKKRGGHFSQPSPVPSTLPGVSTLEVSLRGGKTPS